MQTTTTEELTPRGWAAMLERVEEALARAEADTAAHEKELACAAPLPMLDEGDWNARLEQRKTLLTGVEEFTRKAAENTRDTAFALQAGEEALRDWLTAVETNRRQLTDWDNRESS